MLNNVVSPTSLTYCLNTITKAEATQIVLTNNLAPKNGFKKGADAGGAPRKTFTRLEKSHMIYDGIWKPWPKKDREALLEKIIIAFKLNNNVRSRSAKYLGISVRESFKACLLKNS